jgi:hypothetical protein
MQKDEVRKIADKLVAHSNKDIALFKIDEYGGEGEYFIKANSDGLRLYSAELLYASLNENDSKTYGLSNAGEWLEDEYLALDYVELVNHTRQQFEPERDVESFGQKLFSFGCYIGLVLIVVFIVAGMRSIFNALTLLF